jgi:thioester reductase-like protein
MLLAMSQWESRTSISMLSAASDVLTDPLVHRLEVSFRDNVVSTQRCIELCLDVAQSGRCSPGLTLISTLSVFTSRCTTDFLASFSTVNEPKVVQISEQPLSVANPTIDSAVGPSLYGSYAASKYAAEFLCERAVQRKLLNSVFVSSRLSPARPLHFSIFA